MPNAMDTLRNLNSPSNFGQSAGTYTPRVGRNNARVAGLRKFFGMPGEDDGSISQADYESAFGDVQDESLQMLQAGAQAKAYPQQVAGGYRVRAEQTRAQANAEARAAQLEQQRQMQEDRQAFAAEQSQATRAAQSARSAGSQEAIAARMSATQRALGMRQQNAANTRRAANIRSGKEKAPGAAAPYGFLGFGKSQDAANKELLSTLESQDSGMSEAAADYAPFVGLSDDALLAKIQQTQPDATPDEMLQLFDEVRRMK